MFFTALKIFFFRRALTIPMPCHLTLTGEKQGGFCDMKGKGRRYLGLRVAPLDQYPCYPHWRSY